MCTTVCYAQKAGDVIAAPSVQQMEKYFAVEELSDELLGRMRGKSLPEEKEKWARETLRYVKVLHVGLDGKTHVGELVCNKLIAQDLRSIFLELYRNKYIIERMVIVDEYGGDDNLFGGEGVVLFLNKKDLIAFGDVRSSTTLQPVYEIIPDGNNPNTGVIKDGGLSVKYCINANCTAL